MVPPSIWLHLVNVGFIFSYILLGLRLGKAGGLMFIFAIFFLVCALLFVSVSLVTLKMLGFIIDNIILLIFAVGAFSIFGIGMLFSNERNRIRAMVITIFIAAISLAGFLAGVILLYKPAAEKPIVERTAIVTPIEGAETLQKEKEALQNAFKRLADDFIVIFGVLLIILLAIPYYCAALIIFDLQEHINNKSGFQTQHRNLPTKTGRELRLFSTFQLSR